PQRRPAHTPGSSMRAPRPPLQPSAVALEPRATVKLQPDVDIDLGQQRNLDSATQAAERECRHGRSQLGMRADVTAALVEADRDVEPSVTHGAPSQKPQLQPSCAGRERKAPHWLKARSWLLTCVQC